MCKPIEDEHTLRLRPYGTEAGAVEIKLDWLPEVAILLREDNERHVRMEYAKIYLQELQEKTDAGDQASAYALQMIYRLYRMWIAESDVMRSVEQLLRGRKEDEHKNY